MSALPKKRWLNLSSWKLLSLSIFALILFTVLAIWARNTSLRRQIAAELELLRAGGAPATLQAAAKEYESLSAAENAAPILLEGFALIRKLPPNLDDYAFLDRPPEDLSTLDKTRQAARQFLEAHQPALALLDEALQRKRAAFQLTWSFGMNLPHLSPVRDYVRLLALRAHLSAQQGDIAAVARDLERMNGLCRMIEKDPWFFSHFLRSGIFAMAVQSIQFALNTNPALSASELDLLSRSIPTTLPVHPVLRSERVIGASVLFPVTNPAPAGNPAISLFIKATGIFLQDQLAWLRCTRETVNAATNGFPEALNLVEPLKAEIEETSEALSEFLFYKLGTGKVLPSLHLETFPIAIRKSAALHAELRMAHLALLLERHRAAEGKYPATISELPGFSSSEVFIDPFTGNPFPYEKLETGFLLYSFGQDRTDQQGQPRSKEDPDAPHDRPFLISRPPPAASPEHARQVSPPASFGVSTPALSRHQLPSASFLNQSHYPSFPSQGAIISVGQFLIRDRGKRASHCSDSAPHGTRDHLLEGVSTEMARRCRSEPRRGGIFVEPAPQWFANSVRSGIFRHNDTRGELASTARETGAPGNDRRK